MSESMDIIEETRVTEETVEEAVVEETQAEQVELTEEEIAANKVLKAYEILPELLEKLEADNTQYELHVQLIETLKVVELPDELEKARVNMHQVYPLSEDLWIDWINDTKKKAFTEEGRERLFQLYKDAQEDYLSIRIWTLFVDFILDEFNEKFNDESVKSETEELTVLIESTRTQLLKAVGATTFHVKQSQEIWRPYAEFELAILTKFKNPDQLERVKKMYLDRLAVLHIDCDETFSLYSTFVTAYDNANYEQNLSETNKIYAKTKQAAEERDVFEMKLISTGFALDSFFEYIENEKVTKLMPSLNIVRCLYERAIVYYCTDPSLWDEYILFLIEKARVVSYLEKVCVRATRNCPWSGILYAHRARLQESEQVDNDQITRIFDAALTNKQLLSSVEDLVTILLAKIDFERRKIDWEDPEEDDIINLQVTFLESFQYLNEAFPVSGDPYYRIEKYYAYICAKRLAEPEKAREMWEGIIDKHGRDTEAWIQYITFERDEGNYQVCESLFKKAIDKSVDDPMRLMEVWTSMEHEFGTLESYEQASIRINRKMKRITRHWQKALAAKVEQDEERAKEKAQAKLENERRKKGLHRMKQKEKQKDMRVDNPYPPRELARLPKSDAGFKKPAFKKKDTAFDDFKKPLPVSRPKESSIQDTERVEEEVKTKEAVVEEESKEKIMVDKEQSTEDATTSPSLKRKASDNTQEDEAKKHKADQSTAPPPRVFRPQPRSTRGTRGGRGKALKFRGTQTHNTTQDTTSNAEPSTAAQDPSSKSNDDFRNMLLGKKMEDA